MCFSLALTRARVADSESARNNAAAKILNHAFLMRSLNRKEEAVKAFQRAMQLNPRINYDDEIAQLRK